MNIVFLDQATVQYQAGELDYSLLQRLGTLIAFDFSTAEEVPTKAQEAEVIIVNKVPLTKTTFSRLPNLKLVVLPATGYDNVDVQAAREHNVAVANVPAYSTDAVAQLTITFILALATNFLDHITDVRTKHYDLNARLRHRGLELRHKTLGLIGFGNIGKQVATLAQAFGMQLVVNTRTPHDTHAIRQVDLQTLARQVDFVSIHCPLTEQTRGLINAQFFQAMKPTAFIINTARGAIINELDLVAALQNKIIAGAGLDVLEKEPPPVDHPLLAMKNVLITPHIAWVPQETRNRVIQEVAQNIASFFAGKPRNIVN